MATQPRNFYALLHDFKQDRNLDPASAEDATKDEEMLRYLYLAARMWEGSTLHWFYPKYETRYFDFPQPDDTWLKVDEPLLEVVEFYTQNATVEVTTAQYYLMCGDSYNLMPYDRLSLKSDGTRPNLLYSGTPQKSQYVTGYWGYHEEWSKAWQGSGDEVEDNPLTAAATIVTVNDADGAGVYGFTPRFKVGQIIRVVTAVDSVDTPEFMEIISIDTTTNKLGVIRGINGTTALEHVQNTAIDIYLPMGEIQRAVLRLSEWMYAQRDGPYTRQIQTSVQGTTITIPEVAPPDVIQQAKIYKRFDL